MPTNIELAINEALCTPTKPPRNTTQPPGAPDIAQVITAYIRIAGFTEPQSSINPSSPDATSSAALSDAAVISAFERALEKHASPRSKAGSEAAKLVARVRRDYWRGVLMASGSQDDELTQLLVATQNGPPASPTPTCASGACQSPPLDNQVAKSKSKKTVTNSTTDTPSSAANTRGTARSFASGVSTGLEGLIGRREGYYGTLTRPERSQIYLKGQGWKTLYPCPCCGSMVRAQEVLRVLDLDLAEDDEPLDDSVEIEEPQSEKVKTTKKKRRTKVAKVAVGGGEEGERPRKRKVVKRGAKVKKEGNPVVAFDPYGPSTSKASM